MKRDNIFEIRTKVKNTMSSQLIDKFKQLDAYAKTLEDFRIKTATGAASNIPSC